MIFPRFDSVYFFFPFAFLIICHSEYNTTILSLLFLLDALLKGVRVLTENISTVAKLGVLMHTESRGSNLFGPAIVGALRRTQAITHCIHATVLFSRRDGKAPRAEYWDFFRGLDISNRDFFATAITKCIDDVTVKLPVVVCGVMDKIMDNFLSNLLPHQAWWRGRHR